MKLVLCWHMHQPDYRLDGRFLKPWTWLHAIKDYSDMAAHLEDIEGARAVVNFSPVLMLQLREYPQRIRALLEDNTPCGDAILDALAGPLPDRSARTELTHSLLRVNEFTMKPRFEAYARLFDEAKQALEEGAAISNAALNDLLVRYVLAWLGESLRAQELPVRLHDQSRPFDRDDRRALLAWLAEVMDTLLPRYRELADAGRIELSVTPWSHPILPLLLDAQCARESMPDSDLPGAHYPGGAQRCDWQLEAAIELFRAQFGTRPAGCWPSEGGVSTAVVRVLGRHGFRWTASGTQVLRNSLAHPGSAPQLDTWSLNDAGSEARASGSPVLFFRDDELSDRIGFEYSKWSAEDAVEDLLARIEQRVAQWRQDRSEPGEPVLSIIMDGENAWEHFPGNGREFLRLLYTRLAGHSRIHLCTFSEAVNESSPRPLEQLTAGSWVHGTFSTWIGDPAKNRAWELLADAKKAVDAALAPVLQDAKIEDRSAPAWTRDVLRQLAVCEASDWAWWLGPENRLRDGPEFDRLYRLQLSRLYRLLGLAPPSRLDLPIESTPALGQEPASPAEAGAMRRSGAARE